MANTDELPKSIPKTEYLRLKKMEEDINARKLIEKPNGKSDEGHSGKTTAKDNSGASAGRIDNKNPEVFKASGEGIETEPIEPPKDDGFTCEDCGNPIEKGQPKCGFCQANLDWSGVE